MTKPQAAPEDDLTPARLRQAKRVWSSLEVLDQIRLLREVVESRSKEFRLAYRGVVWVHFGYRTRRRQLRYRVRRELVLKFVVKKKWPKALDHERAVPPYILAFAGAAPGKRELCAIPTDVTPIRFFKSYSHAAAIIATFDSSSRTLGNLACRITSSVLGAPHVISCAHVFGASALSGGAWPTGAAVAEGRMNGEQMEVLSPPVASVSNIRGPMIENGGSFDAALAEVTNPAGIDQLLSPGLAAFAPDANAIVAACDCTIQTVRAGKIRARVVMELPPSKQEPTQYFSGLRTRQNVLVFKLLCDKCCLEGDSGSPVTSSDGLTLFGMHFAGLSAPNEHGETENRAYMIPAYELLSSDNYSNISKNLTFTLSP